MRRTKTNRKIKEMKKWKDYRSGKYLISWLVEIIVGMKIELRINPMMEEEIKLGKNILEAKQAKIKSVEIGYYMQGKNWCL